MVTKYPKRGDIFWVKLDPTIGSEIKKTRPAMIVSTDLQNQYSNLIIIAPITSKIKKNHPFRVPITIAGKEGKILINQIRSIDKRRLSKQLAMCEPATLRLVDEALKIVLDLT
jgi:mRNA interferase MazF